MRPGNFTGLTATHDPEILRVAIFFSTKDQTDGQNIGTFNSHFAGSINSHSNADLEYGDTAPVVFTRCNTERTLLKQPHAHTTHDRAAVLNE